MIGGRFVWTQVHACAQPWRPQPDAAVGARSLDRWTTGQLRLVRDGCAGARCRRRWCQVPCEAPCGCRPFVWQVGSRTRALSPSSKWDSTAPLAQSATC